MSVAESHAAVPQDPHSSYRGSNDATAVSAATLFRPPGARPVATPAPGEMGAIGSYRLLKQLGKGGMGAVYLALDTRLDRKIALKVMLPECAADADAKERFLREARAAAKVNHDNVVTVYEADERDGVPYIAMQFLQGYPLDEYLKNKGAPSLLHILRIARETALGLSAAHVLGLVHRDIKPGNLWLEAPNGRVKVLDFGLAKPLGHGTELTHSGMVVGTPAYMSPEQGRGHKVDARSDLFSLGVVLYRLCTGKTPFDGANAMDVMIALGTKDPVPVRALNPNVPESLAGLIHRLLAKEPGDRPQTASEVAKLLRAVSTQLTHPRPADVSTSQPVVVTPLPVVVSPMLITAPHSAFADLDAKEPTQVESAAESKPVRKRARGWGAPIAAGAAALAALLVAGAIVIKITNKDGSVTEIKVPDGAKVEVNGKSVGPAPKPPAPPADPDRRAAEYLLSVGGTVRIDGDDRDISTAADLPRTAFKLTSINFHGNNRITDAGLAAFKDCKHLTHLVLHDCKQVTSAGLAHFKDCKDLVWLSLAQTPTSDAALAVFKDCKNLRALNLQGSEVTDAGLAYFKDCKGLGELGLRDCTQFTAAGLAHFKDCTELGSLDLVCTRATDEGLAHFKNCKNLQALGLIETRITATGFALLPGWKNLTRLELNGTQLGDAHLTHLSELTALRELCLSGTKVTAKGVEGLAKALPNCKIVWSGGTHEPKPEARGPDRAASEYVCSVGGMVRIESDNRLIKTAAELPRNAFRLAYVELNDGSKVTDAGLAAFKGCTNLTYLSLCGAPVTANGLAHFKECKGLGALSMISTPVTDAGLAHFKDCKGLGLLILKDTPLKNVALSPFKDCKNLYHLDLSGTGLPNAEVAHFKDCNRLSFLELSGTAVTDAGLAHFKDCGKLMYLHLRRCAPVTDAGLAHFRESKELFSVQLNGTGVTDAGLVHLAGLDKMTALDLSETKVTATGVEGLAKALPRCRITWNGGTHEPKK